MTADPEQRGILDPTHDPARFERIVQHILDAAEPELARRRKQVRILAGLVARWRPLLAAAAVVAVFAAGTLAFLGGPDATDFASAADGNGLSEAIGIPADLDNANGSGELGVPGYLLAPAGEDE